MRLYFDVSLGGAAPQLQVREWESLLATLHSRDVHLVDEPSQADAIIHTGASGQFESRASWILRPLKSNEIRQLVWDWGDAPLGRASGFYCSLPKMIFDQRRHRTMSYPIAFNELIDEFPLQDAALDFSFVGGVTAGVRARLVEKFGNANAWKGALVQVQAGNWGLMFDRSGSRLKRDYADSVRKSKFVLCPRGAGVGSIRLFEALKAGRPPVIISDSYVLPSGIDWSSCSLRVRESEIDRIPAIVQTHLPVWAAMAHAARRVWLENFSERNLLRYLTEHVSAINAELPRVSAVDRWRYAGRAAMHLASSRVRPLVGRARGRLHMPWTI